MVYMFVSAKSREDFLIGENPWVWEQRLSPPGKKTKGWAPNWSKEDKRERLPCVFCGYDHPWVVSISLPSPIAYSRLGSVAMKPQSNLGTFFHGTSKCSRHLQGASPYLTKRAKVPSGRGYLSFQESIYWFWWWEWSTLISGALRNLDKHWRRRIHPIVFCSVWAMPYCWGVGFGVSPKPSNELDAFMHLHICAFTHRFT